ncbi:hypothetical protein CEG14_01350 [Bordetella genomosp. 1]|uniref:Uncharacterized protein n=1 Tax=Bordetella genomosp. 1 TaxID=1395607 RepID=A0A261STM2_9BORD|nr:hypothetical protein [Bordetella genomosp. 1]OZI40441.1 hypothetical protein CEG14_01350 [Bordetella genomosp. 1]
MTISSGLPGLSGPNPSSHSDSDVDASVGHTAQRPGSSPGTGAMQGSLVGVGDGGEGTALREDAQASRGWFGGVTTFLSTFWEAATEFTEQMHGGGLYDDEPDVTGEPELTDPPEVTGQPEVTDVRAGELDDTALDASRTDSNQAEKNTATDANARAGNDSIPDSNGPSGGDTTPLALAESRDDVRLAPLTLHSEEAPEGVPPKVGEQEARDEAETQVQQQQGGLWNRVCGAVGTVRDATVGLAKGAYNMLPSIRSAPTEVKESAKEISFSQQNLKRAEALSANIDLALAKLNLQLEAKGQKLEGITPQARLDAPELTTRDTLNRWYHNVKGGLSAVVPTLGQMTVGAAIPAAVGLATTPMSIGPTKIALNMTALLGGAYLGITALRDYPQLANDSTVVSLIEETLQQVATDFAMVQDILGQEQARGSASIRTMLAGLEHLPRLDALRTELGHVEAALRKAEAGETTPVTQTAPRHAVSVGDGAARSETLGLAARARDAFSSFFGTIGRGLASVGRFIADLPNVPGRFLERREARSAEAAEVSNNKMMFVALRSAGSDSRVRTGIDVGAMRRAQANGASTDIKQVSERCLMGENLMRSLQSASGQSFGTVRVDAGKPLGEFAVPASLTTARALGWYLDAIAVDATPDSADTDDAAVVRNADGSLTVRDPDRKLYSFLMNVPVAYTGAMAGTQDGNASTFMIDDHGQNMPQGMRGMRFDTGLDAKGEPMLSLSFTAAPQHPVFKPLGNEVELLRNAYVEIHTPRAQQTAIAPDLSGLSVDALRQRSDELNAAITRELSMAQANNAQVKALEDWKNPAFLSGRV